MSTTHATGIVLAMLSALAASPPSKARADYASHPPIRPLPEASTRPMADGVGYFVDPDAGDDANDGSIDRPWQSLRHALSSLGPGVTIYLRGGAHWADGQVLIGPEQSGTPDAPATIRSYPGELAVVDFGIREFQESPETAWEPYPDGAPGEFVSTGTYMLDEALSGNFGDSMVPLFRYIFIEDLRSTNELFHEGLQNRAWDPEGLYAGPGVWWNRATGRLHARLAHTNVDGLGDSNYRGETDPRRIPLVISNHSDPARFRIHDASHVRVQDLVLRGSTRATVAVRDGQDIELDGLHVYGGSPAIQLSGTNIRLIDSRVRGFDAPWHSRFHDKNRSSAGYLVRLNSGDDIVLAGNEFTDHHDGVTFEQVEDVSFHHNLVDNMNDDGIFRLSARRERGVWLVHENVFRRCGAQCMSQSTPSFTGEIEPGTGNYVFRNFFDLRGSVYGGPPSETRPIGMREPRLIGEHGGGFAWHDYYVYQNTIVSIDGGHHRAFYGFELAIHTRGCTRRVFNNVFVAVTGVPGQQMPPPEDDFVAAGNLFWSLADGASGDRPEDVYADPRLEALEADFSVPADIRLRADSPAIDRGVELPAEWPDPLRDLDEGAPDIGAIPFGADTRLGPGAPAMSPGPGPGGPAAEPDAGVGAGGGGPSDPPASVPAMMPGDGCACSSAGSARDGRNVLWAFALLPLALAAASRRARKARKR